MELDTIELTKKNGLLDAYLNDPEFLHTFFDYEMNEENYRTRADELAARTFQRRELAQAVQGYMEPFGISEPAARHIQELSEDALVVIGGQQAGILTGPLYSVHKAVSVILLADEQRRLLGRPVVPVFWIAGEDHDINEINHTFTLGDGRAVKQQFTQKYILKEMASDTFYDADEMGVFIRKIFKEYGETAYTQGLLQDVLDTVEGQRTFTGFFTALMNGLFREYGLLLIDAASKELRRLESPYFSQMIENAEKMAASVHAAEQKLHEKGFPKPIEAEEHDANLFYVHETGRLLLKKKDGLFVNEQTGLEFTVEEMYTFAAREPWLLSNNVATRPLMQDLVFPVLAFVGGPGEIAYWSLLRDSFHILGIRMPVVVPRLSITIVTRQVQEAMKQTGVEIGKALSGELPKLRDRWLAEQGDAAFDSLLDEMKTQLGAQFQKLQAHAERNDRGLLPVIRKNLQFHEKQFDYLQKQKVQSILRKHEVQFNRYQTMNGQLLPDGSLQERLYSPYYFINQFGEGFIDELLKLPFRFDGTHQVVYL